MSTIYELDQQLAALKEQRASGVAKVSYSGRTVEYRSIQEIDKAIFKIQEEISVLRGSTKSRQLKTYSSKGL